MNQIHERETYRDKLEQQLRESEERFRDFAETAGDWFWETDVDHRFSDFLGQTEMSGLDLHKMKGQRRWDLPTVEPSDPVWSEHRRMMDTHRPFRDFQYRYKDRDGNTRIARVNGKPFFGSDGQFLGYRGTAQDITQSKSAQFALEASEEKYRQAVQLAKLGYWIWDELNNRCEYCSTELAAIHGVSVEEYLARTSSIERDLEWYHPDDRQRYEAVTREATMNKTGYESLVRVVLDDGQVRHLHELTKAVTDENGQLVKTVGVLQDVTEKVAAEQALRESEQRLKTFVDNLPGAAYRVQNDENWTVGYRSAGYLDLVGVSPHERALAEAFDKYPPLAVDPEDLARIRKEIAHAIEQDRNFEFKYRITDETGEIRWLWERGRCVSAPGQKPEVLEGLILDITQSRKSEQALLQTQKLQVVGQMSGGIAHDFNNLLGVIQSNTELLMLEGANDSPKLQTILRAASKGAELTQRLLAFSKQQLLSPEVVDVNASIEDITELAARVIRQDIAINFTKDPNAWPIWVDRAQLENAVLNLLLNARDAMPKGGMMSIKTTNATLEAQAGTQHTLSDGDYVRLEICDTGCGIAAERLNSVFEPFFTTKAVGEGSGLGLSMVQGFAEQSGGHVTISSELGKGTTIDLYLPRSRHGLTATPSMVSEPVSELAASGLVLLVDDEPDMRTILGKMLETVGFEVIQAADGRQAQAVMETTTKIDILLSDVVLPGGLSGYDIAQIAEGHFPEIATILMSGYASELPPTALHRDKSLKFIQKPFRMADLIETLKSASGLSLDSRVA